NLEATPAESTTYRLAKHDVKRFPDIITAARNPGDTPYYTNSSHLPVWYTEDIFSALDIQDQLQTLYTSGTVFHAFLGEKLPDWKAAADLVRKIAENYTLPYYTLSPTYSVCKEHGYLAGEQFTCPECGQPTEVYSRITGYYRPVQNWNDGKTQEYKDRRLYDIAHSKLTHTGAPAAKADVPEEVPADTKSEDVVPNKPGTLLFATATCPNCKIAAALLEKADVPFEKILAEDNAELAHQYEIRQAPTLVVFDENGFTKHLGVSEIKKFIESK
ncbi:MAG: ribonucleoside triphosphate reductase, partial [Clostridia bacterium]|nr:ribonucleoside triphosphate reductase [Clostridia bacterium]